MLFLMPLLSKEENIKKHIRKFSGRLLRKKKNSGWGKKVSHKAKQSKAENMYSLIDF